MIKKMKYQVKLVGFPSPTGVTYYEYILNKIKENQNFGFRPQQGVTYYECAMDAMKSKKQKMVSVPNRGLPIMKYRSNDWL